MIDLHEAQNIAVEAAKAAGERIIQGYSEQLNITIKSDPADLLTQVDIDAQNIIEQTIFAKYPDHQLLGEEDEEGKEKKESEYRWVVDPVDGTSNFTQRLPHVGVSIALQHNEESVLGVLYFPVLDNLYTAIQGEGAFLNGKQIHVASCASMRDAYISEIYSDRVNRGNIAMYPPAKAYRRFGSAVTSLGYIAAGSIHGTALRCYLWDIAAAQVIIPEAGGKIEWRFHDEGNERSSLTCIASVPEIYDELAEFVQQEFERNPGV